MICRYANCYCEALPLLLPAVFERQKLAHNDGLVIPFDSTSMDESMCSLLWAAVLAAAGADHHSCWCFDHEQSARLGAERSNALIRYFAEGSPDRAGLPLYRTLPHQSILDMLSDEQRCQARSALLCCRYV